MGDFTKQAVLPWRFQCDVAFSGITPVAVPITFLYKAKVQNDADASVSLDSLEGSRTVDLIASGAATVTVAGDTATYLRVAQFLKKIADAQL